LEQGVLKHVQQGQTELRYLPCRLWPAALAATAIATACATNPVTGRREFTLMSEAQEVAVGRESDAQIKAEMGIYEDAALQQYVSRIGLQLAKLSERPNLPWQFTVVDQPAVNAFALPGGFICITRGILPFLNDEAELAGVLGHEIGHVTARHSVRQYTRAVGGTLLLGVSASLSLRHARSDRSRNKHWGCFS
jgi:predicted Zn-dependent protease